MGVLIGTLAYMAPELFRGLPADAATSRERTRGRAWTERPPAGTALHADLGNVDEALKWLAFEPHHAFVPWARVSPEFKLVWTAPGFPEFLNRLKLPPRPAR